MKRKLMALLALCATALFATEFGGLNPKGVKDSEPTIASDFDFDPENASRCLLDAICCGATSVKIDNINKKEGKGDTTIWYLDQIEVSKFSIELIIEDGVVIRPLPGSKQECILNFSFHSYSIIRGEGSAKFDLAPEDGKEKSSCKYAIKADRSQLMLLHDVAFEHAPADGAGIALVGDGSMPVDASTFHHLTFRDNANAGIYANCIRDVTIRDCKFIATDKSKGNYGLYFSGTGTQKATKKRYVRANVKNCQFNGLGADAIFMDVSTFGEKTVQQSMNFENCVASNCAGYGFNFTANGINITPGGAYQFSNCQFIGNKSGAIAINGQKDSGNELSFTGCTFDATGSGKPAIFLSTSTFKHPVEPEVKRVPRPKVTAESEEDKGFTLFGGCSSSKAKPESKPVEEAPKEEAKPVPGVVEVVNNDLNNISFINCKAASDAAQKISLKCEDGFGIANIKTDGSDFANELAALKAEHPAKNPPKAAEPKTQEGK